jgi:ADP-heptose:LPS heptosyltransferase
MKDICIFSHHSSLGDLLNITPIIKEISIGHNCKIILYTHIPNILINNPYIKKIIKIDNNIDIYQLKKEYHYLYEISKPKINNVFKQRITHLIDSSSMDIGFTLTPQKKTLQFYPNKYSNKFNLPNKYIVIAPTITWETRTWPKTNWQILVNLIKFNYNIDIISIGKSNYIDKSVFKNINNVIDLTDKTSLSDTWHILNKSILLITMDNGILHLGGCTDTHILLMPTIIDPYSRAPFRYGSQDYKFNYINGQCTDFCGTTFKYSVKTVGNLSWFPKVSTVCLNKYKTYKCHPNPYDVYQKVKSILDNYLNK